MLNRIFRDEIKSFDGKFVMRIGYDSFSWLINRHIRYNSRGMAVGPYNGHYGNNNRFEY